MIYTEDLAYIQHDGFGDFSRNAAPGVLEILRGCGVDDGLVLELGCGTGVLAAALLGAGYDVIGVDVSAAILQYARRLAPAARFVAASLYSLELPRCSAIVAIGEGLTYIAPEDPRLALPRLLERSREALVPDGVLLFDFIRSSPEDPMHYRASREGKDWRVEVEVVEEPGERLLTRRIVSTRSVGGAVRSSEELHRVRTFGEAEVRAMLDASGFSAELTERIGTFPLAPRRAAVVARPRRKIGP